MAHQQTPMFAEGLPDPEKIFQSWWPIIIALAGGFLYGFRQYMRGARCFSEVKLDGKVAIVTGATSGIGKHVAEDFARRGCRVYIACRNMEQGKKVVEEIQEKTKNINIYAEECNLASFKSVRAFVKKFREKEEKLDILVNNAGVMMCPYAETEDKFEEQFQVNFLSHALLTHLLLDLLKNSTPSRIINTTANAFSLGVINFEDVNFKSHEYSPGVGYSQSKLAVMAFSLALSEHLQDTGVSVYIINPGVVNTNLHRHMPFRQNAFISLGFSPFFWYLTKAPEDGAQTTIYCAISENLENVSGQYYKECQKEKIDKDTVKTELPRKTWDASLNWLQIQKFGHVK
ncbi:hypothetical protein CHS0354_034879 [Potamilus streckersoni]|uniref:Uncharacterized protein n=1 Tax=Potamilus streckersoni TaxID=2493646 RepID=A0AAE0S7N4_9BIVA|nr:hypothetical protein CHS0354_034879 [Potamilus streckersoni]